MTGMMKFRTPSESSIQKAGDDYLALDGWRRIVTDPPQLRGLGVSELGIPDRQYIRYATYNPPLKNDKPLWTSKTETMWVEYKKKGGLAGQHQKDWHARERALGALVVVLGEDGIDASIEGLVLWYRSSGLMRKNINLSAGASLADKQRTAKTRAGRLGGAASRKRPGTLKSELRES